MGILKSVGNFLFGKDPDIFDEDGRVRHKLEQQKWDAWNDRFRTNPDYDWKNHKGKERGKPASNKQIKVSKA